MKIGQVNSESTIHIEGFFKKLNVFLTFKPPRTFVQNGGLPKISIPG